MKRFVGMIVLSMFLLACDRTYTPKPRAYFYIDLPPKSYQMYQGDCPFVFEQPSYAQVVQDSSYNAEPCWLNMNFLPYNATLHLTYKPIGPDFSLADLQNDTRRFVMNHTIKAQDIIPLKLLNEEDQVYGLLYHLTGNTATALQFYVTDSTTHYLRGALYFNTHTNPDSIAPVLKYLTTDVEQMIETLKWKD